MYLFLVFGYQSIWHIAPLIPFSIINNLSISVKGSNFTLSFSKAAYHGNPDPVRKRAS